MSDYISREQALGALAEYVASGFAESADDLQGYTDTINKIPSADVRENIKGKWKWNKPTAPISYCKCSVCGGGQWEMEWNFCPNCGADMRGE